MNWLILIHQIPSKPTYFRAKIGRRLKQVGAIPIKQAVYVLPEQEQCSEDFRWIAKEINDQGGDAMVLTAEFLQGLTDQAVFELFRTTRQADYEEILNEAQALMNRYHSKEPGGADLSDCTRELERLKKAFKAIAAIDYFPAADRARAGAFLDEMETIFHDPGENGEIHGPDRERITGKTWVTKENVYVDRLASAWFIRRFVDPDAKFKFVDASSYQPGKNELRFDMQEAEYTHQGSLCTFEALVQSFAPRDKGVQQIAKLIHDIDLKDDAFGLPEKAGIQAVVDSIVLTTQDDMSRIELAGAIFDGLLANYNRQLPSKEK